MTTKDTFVEGITILNKKRVTDFARADDVAGIGTGIRVVYTDAEINISTTLAGNGVTTIISTIAKNEVLTFAAVGRAVDVLGIINRVATGNVFAFVDSLGRSIVDL